MISVLKPHPKTELNTALANDFIDLLDHHTTAHMGKWKYSNKNFSNIKSHEPKDYWQEFTHSSSYYISDAERDLIRTSLPQVITKLRMPVTNFIEFGPGASDAVQSKTVPFLHAIKTIKKYIPIDVEQGFLDQASDVVRHTGLRIQVQKINSNFYEPLSISKESDKAYQMAAMFGCTISNIEQAPYLPFPQLHLTKQLISLRSFLKKNDAFVLTVDSNQNEESLIAAYAPQKDMYMNLLWRIKHETNTSDDFDPNKFEFKPVWFPDSHALSHAIICKEPMSFSIMDRYYNLHKGQVFYFHNCYKIPSHLMIEVGQHAGFEHKAVHTDLNGRLCLHLFQVK